MNESIKPQYQRILLKLSGEALLGNNSHFGIDPVVLDRIAAEIAEVCFLGVQVGLVIGGGNFFRGQALASVGLGRVTGDQMGMVATIMNSLALRDALERIKIPTHIFSAIPMFGIVEPYDRRKAIQLLQEGNVVIFSAGTGNPFFTTDSAASLRAIEIDADLLMKATNVDGIYSSDPAKDSNAMRYHHITYQEALEQELGVMDLAAFCQCRDYNISLRVFNVNKPNALLHIIQGMNEGTLVTKEK